MYMPKHFAESDPQVLADLIDRYPLATIVNGDADELDAEHIPLRLFQAEDGTTSLRGHVARANELWRKAIDGCPCLVIFRGADGYISPNWYASKHRDGKAVPTWNYEAVHVKGSLIAHDDPHWLRELLDWLTSHHEANEPRPWKLEDAPAEYIDAMLRGCVGIEVRIDLMIGKFKLSQNQSEENRQGILDELAERVEPRAQMLKSAMDQQADRSS